MRLEQWWNDADRGKLKCWEIHTHTHTHIHAYIQTYIQT